MFIHTVVLRPTLIEARKQFNSENYKAVCNVSVVGMNPSPQTQVRKKNCVS